MCTLLTHHYSFNIEQAGHERGRLLGKDDSCETLGHLNELLKYYCDHILLFLTQACLQDSDSHVVPVNAGSSGNVSI